jgi:hypothetical protein
VDRLYEHISQDVLPVQQFIFRLLKHIGVAFVLGAVSLGGGMAGYHHFNHLSWLDSFVNASMILGGMGPVDPLASDAAKYFGGAYALYAGLLFVVIVGIIMAPVAHRILHRLHADEDA